MLRRGEWLCCNATAHHEQSPVCYSRLFICAAPGCLEFNIPAFYVYTSLPLCTCCRSVKFVSVKIGDTRLGSMETGVGLSRGIKAGE